MGDMKSSHKILCHLTTFLPILLGSQEAALRLTKAKAKEEAKLPTVEGAK